MHHLQEKVMREVLVLQLLKQLRRVLDLQGIQKSPKQGGD